MPGSDTAYAMGQRVTIPWLPYSFRIAGGGGAGMITGTQRHVRSAAPNAADVTDAGTFAQPYATVDYAISRSVANDWIWVHGGHAETLAADSALDVDIAGITVAWTGSGVMPTFTFATAAAADMKMAAAGCRVFGMRFLCNIASQGMMIEWQADDCELAWCEFREGSATGLNFISIGLADGDSDRFYIHHNTFHAPTAGNYDHAIAALFDMAGGRLEDNIIYGDFDEAGIDVPAGGNAQVNLSIRRNTITNLLAGQHAIQINGTTSRGVIEDNTVITDALATSIDPGGLALVGRNVWQVVGDSDFTSVPVFMPADQVTNPIGIDDANNAFDSSTVAGNRDGSLLERLEQVQEDIRRGTGSGLAANESLVDILYGTGGIITFPNAAVPAANVSLAEVLRSVWASIMGTAAGENGITTWPAAAVPADTVSMAEALRYVVEQQLWRLAISAWAFGDGTSDLYTVTGVVEVEIFGVCTSSLTTAGVAPTIEVGVAGNTAVLIAQIVDGRDLLVNEIYFDATPTTTVESLSTVTSRRFVITNGQDIIMTVGGGALTAGAIDFYCRWRPLSATGAVVAA